jgi:hypothetical protein
MRPVLTVVAAFTLVTVLLAWSRWLAGRRWAAAGHLLLALAGAGVVASVWPLSAYLAAYEAWVPQYPVAELFFERTGPDRFRATLTRLPAGRMQVVELEGEQWRLDLRTLTWSEYAAQLGLAPRYRIERLAAQTGKPQASGGPAGAAHALAETADSTPLLARLGARRGTPLLSTQDLAGPWRPMADGARFEVRLTAGNGVEVDPRNVAASDSLATQ